MRSICVFCGSSPGREPLFRDAARQLGRLIGEHGLTLVYGGGCVGLMGELADAALAANGRVVGVITEALVDRELAHLGLSDLRVVTTMHERKAQMSELADAFIALPGGLGTLEEFFEVLTWQQLGIHRKPCALLNVGGYYDPLLAFLDRGVEAGFVSPVHRATVLVDDDAARLLERLRDSVPPTSKEQLSREEL
jgi:uncharacterized protein (TIGR00730 family)